MSLDQNDEPTIETSEPTEPAARVSRPRRRAASRPAGPPSPVLELELPDEQPVLELPAAELPAAEPSDAAPEPTAEQSSALPARAPRKRAPRRKAVAEVPAEPGQPDVVLDADLEVEQVEQVDQVPTVSAPALAMPLFQPPDPTAAAPRRRRAATRPTGAPAVGEPAADADQADQGGPGHAGSVDGPEVHGAPDPEADLDADVDTAGEATEDAEEDDDAVRRRRRRRGGRGRRPRRDGESTADPDGADAAEATTDQGAGSETAESEDGEPGDDGETDSAGSRRRRRRRRRGAGGDAQGDDDPPNTVTRVRESRQGSSDVSGVRGSTRLEAKKQRRREGREAGRRRPVITEAEFLARRESVERVMVVRENEGRTQIAVLEDGVLVEHYVARRTQTSMVGNVYLGRVQNVLPSMEAAFVDIGKGRNAVLYAGEVNWDAAGLDGQPKRIEHALKSGESVLVQVTKDPIGHKGARLTSQVSLPGRYLVYVPDGSMTGISRKLPDTERSRLKRILRDVVPEDAGVIVRTAAEGASEDELGRDVARLSAQWADIAAKSGAVNAPALLYGEPDLAIRVVRDIFNEDFASLVISGDDTWDVLHAYIGHVAPDLVERLTRWNGEEIVDGVARGDAFAAHRVDEQLAKALDRKVYLPSGGSLVIDRTEAMTVVDVNTGKFTGAGGNLEETVTKNNLEAAEEVVRQLRLRDIGGIIVVDFIDMVLESNRDLVLRRLLECLGRDRTKHQVAEVTSLGLVQMTRKRVGQGLLEVFSETCEHCNGRGVIVHDEPVEKRQQDGDNGGSARSGRSSRSGRGGRGGNGGGGADAIAG